ncbi:MAG: hypothetical protein IPJ76_17105 [Flavobacteriales bacterium]|nr:MAG: hypothetical protein IPJ76_17105 [Flavobacteriales bacterium]
MKFVPTAACLALCASLPMALYAQDVKPRNHGHLTIQKGLELEEKDDLAGAVTLYATVNRNDSLYERALLRQVNVLARLDRYAEVLVATDRGLALDNERKHYFLLNKALALHELKRYDEAIALLKEGMQRYPGNFHMHNMYAATLESKGDMAGAFEAFKTNVLHFPLSQEAHMNLGNLAIMEGRTSQAALSYFMALTVSWGDTRSERALIRVDELLNNNLDAESKGYDLGNGDAYTELDLLLKNKVAMNKGYKLKPDLPYPCVRQGHFLLSTLTKQEPGSDFWGSFYMPFFNKLMQNGQFEAFAHHILSNSTNPKINASYNKNKGMVETWRKTLFATFNELYATYPDSCGGTVKPVFHLWNDDHNLLAVGEGNMHQDEQVGPWKFYGDNGAVSMKGEYNAEHKKQGEWKAYHDNGSVSRVNNWANGEENGLFRTWYRNGAPKDSVNVVAGKGDGTYTEFWDTGRIKSRKTFTNGDLTGPASFYHANGALEFNVALVKDEYDGAVKAYTPDGKVKYTGSFAKDKSTGEVVRFHRNGNKESSYQFVDGKRTGPFTEWFVNGTKESEGTYAADKRTGKHAAWYPDGTLRTEGEYDAQGREQGVHKQYNSDGTLHSEFEYRGGLLIRYRYLDRSGKVLGEGKRAKGRFQFVGFTPDGAKRMEGSYLDEGAKDGPWKWYWPDGTLQEEENMKNGEQDGTQKVYRENGKLLREYRYVPGKQGEGTYHEYWLDGSPDDLGYLENGRLNGENRQTHPDGKPYEVEYFADGDREGWQSYYDVDGVLMTEERVHDGVMREYVGYDAAGKEHDRVVLGHGAMVMETKYPDGKVKSRIEYLNMVRHGKGTWFYPDGSKEQEGQYVNGDAHGAWKGWHPNGKIRFERTYDMDELTGVSKFYTLEGLLESEDTYENGWSTGYKEFHRNGKPVVERQRRFGEEHGTTKSWNMAGELQLVRYYWDGRLIGYSHSGADGKLVDTIPLGEGLVQLRPKYANGTVSREMDFRNGELHGTYKEFYSDGKVMEVSNYDCGVRTGTGTEYWPSGKIAGTSNWQNGMRHGEFIDYWETGQPMDKCTWKFGERHGERILYDKTGKPTLILTYRDDEVMGMRKP